MKAKTLIVNQARVIADLKVRVGEPKSRNGKRKNRNGKRTLPPD